MMHAAEQFGQLRTWSAPLIDGDVAPGRRGARREREPDAGSVALEKARQEAREAGHAAGLAAARQEIEARLAALDTQAATLSRMLESLSRPLAQLGEEVHGQIARLATGIARALLRRELKMDPAQVIGIVRDTVALLPASTQGVRVVLHPEDAALVRERLAAPLSGQSWAIAEDPVLSRGDCRVVSEYAQVDARMETRLSDALAALLGDERQAPRDGGS
jgi:flagellar assembly protein FliH